MFADLSLINRGIFKAATDDFIIIGVEHLTSESVFETHGIYYYILLPILIMMIIVCMHLGPGYN